MPKITEMYAFVVADKDQDDEGIMGFQAPNGQWMPLVGADMARVESLRPMADVIAKASDREYKILHFKLIGEIT